MEQLQQSELRYEEKLAKKGLDLNQKLYGYEKFNPVFDPKTFWSIQDERGLLWLSVIRPQHHFRITNG